MPRPMQHNYSLTGSHSDAVASDNYKRHKKNKNREILLLHWFSFSADTYQPVKNINLTDLLSVAPNFSSA